MRAYKKPKLVNMKLENYQTRKLVKMSFLTLKLLLKYSVINDVFINRFKKKAIKYN